MIFVVDISESMQGKPIEGTKNALAAALSKLDHGDSFNVIAFNDEIHLFSLSLELATKKAIDKVTEWMSMNMVARGGTNILLPLNQVLCYFHLMDKIVSLSYYYSLFFICREHICGT